MPSNIKKYTDIDTDIMVVEQMIKNKKTKVVSLMQQAAVFHYPVVVLQECWANEKYNRLFKSI
jgi:hypothetical protein